MKSARALVVLVFAAALGACSTGDDDASDLGAGAAGAAGAAGGAGGAGATLEPKFSVVQEKVFQVSCAFGSCHGANGAGGLTLEAGKSYAQLVGVDSVVNSGQKRVVAGDPEGSLLYKCLLGPSGNVEQMPKGAPLDQARIDVVKQWIAAGAKNDLRRVGRPGGRPTR